MAERKRTSKGTFVKGGPGGPGRPPGSFRSLSAADMRRMLAVIKEETTEEDLREVWSALTEGAKKGNRYALSMYLGYVIGKPREMPAPEGEGKPGYMMVLQAMVKDLQEQVGLLREENARLRKQLEEGSIEGVAVRVEGAAIPSSGV